MAKKKIEENIVEKIYDYTLEEIMGDRFGRYAKVLYKIVLYQMLEMV